MVEEFAAIPVIGSKLYPLAAPGDTVAPYVVYGASEGMRVRALDGYKDSKEINVDMNVVAQTYKSMKQNTAAVLDMIISFQQRAIGTEGLFIQEIDLEEPDEIYEDVPKLHKCVISFTVYI